MTFYIRVDFDAHSPTAVRVFREMNQEPDESGIGVFEMGPIPRAALDVALVGFLDNPDILSIYISRNEPDWD